MAVPFLIKVGCESAAGEAAPKNAGKRQRTGAVESGSSKPPGLYASLLRESESKYSLTTSVLT